MSLVPNLCGADRRPSSPSRRLFKESESVSPIVALGGWLLVGVGLTVLAGCGEDSQPSQTEPPIQVEPTFCEHDVDLTSSYAFDAVGIHYEIPAGKTPTVPGGTSVAFDWVGMACTGTDANGADIARSPAGFRYRLLPLETTWRSLAPSVMSVTYPAAQLDNEAYRFEVAAINAREAFGPIVVREFEWNAPPETQFSQFVFPGETESQSVFFAAGEQGLPIEEYEPVRSGDTLSVTAQGVSLWALPTGNDPDGEPGDDGIAAMQVRLLDGPGLWEDVTVGQPFAKDNIYTEEGQDGYILTARAVDKYGRADATPDTVLFFVNRAPRFRVQGVVGGQPFSQSPAPGDVLSLKSLPSSTELEARFLGFDPDALNASRQLLEFSYRFAKYPGPDGKPSDKSYFSDWQAGNPTTGAWETTLSIEDGQREFLAGDFELLVRVRENRSSSLERLGRRVTEQRIPFRIE